MAMLIERLDGLHAELDEPSAMLRKQKPQKSGELRKRRAVSDTGGEMKMPIERPDGQNAEQLAKNNRRRKNERLAGKNDVESARNEKQKQRLPQRPQRRRKRLLLPGGSLDVNVVVPSKLKAQRMKKIAVDDAKNGEQPKKLGRLKRLSTEAVAKLSSRETRAPLLAGTTAGRNVSENENQLAKRGPILECHHGSRTSRTHRRQTNLTRSKLDGKPAERDEVPGLRM